MDNFRAQLHQTLRRFNVYNQLPQHDFNALVQELEQNFEAHLMRAHDNVRATMQQMSAQQPGAQVPTRNEMHIDVTRFPQFTHRNGAEEEVYSDEF